MLQRNRFKVTSVLKNLEVLLSVWQCCSGSTVQTLLLLTPAWDHGSSDLVCFFTIAGFLISPLAGLSLHVSFFVWFEFLSHLTSS